MARSRHEIEIRTWPERSDVLVVDIARATALMQYESDAGRTDSPLFDVFAGHEERAAAAIAAMQRDQDYLKAHFRSDEEVELVEASAPRESLRSLLLGHGLDLDGITIRNLPDMARYLQALDVGRVFALLVDWHDVIERHYPQGASFEDPESWVHRAAPDKACQFHYLASGTEEQGADDEKAYEMFRRLVDCSLAEYSFGFFLRWVYYHRTEFAEFTPFLPIAWQEAGIS